MFRHKNALTITMPGLLAAALAGCSGTTPQEDVIDPALAAAIEAAQAGLRAELPGIPGEVEAVGTRNGIPVVQYHAPEDASAPFTGAYGYGAWLGERGFAVYAAPAEGILGQSYVLANDEDMSEGAPGAADGFSGTWSGVMLGMDTTADDDAGVQGNAQLNLHSGMDGATVDVEFSNVAGINNDREYDGHGWTGISLTGSSFSGTSDEGGSVEGQFYGGHHENVIGDFMYDDLMGAWGAVRRPSDDDDAGGDDDMMGGDDDMGGDDMGGDDMGGDDMGGDDMGGDDMGGDDMGGDDMGGDDMGGDDMGGDDMGGDDDNG